jgi:hypothetical protein
MSRREGDIRRDKKVELNPLSGDRTNVFQDRRWRVYCRGEVCGDGRDVRRGITEDARKGCVPTAHL